MKLKGHKPACKCVGCSAATRRRGAAALHRPRQRPKHKNPLAFHGGKTRPYCGNCGQWQGPTRAGYLDCSSECARRGFEHKRTLRELKKRELGNPLRRKKPAKTSMPLIGTSPRVYAPRVAPKFPGARLYAGPQSNQVSILGKFSKRGSLLGARVSRIDYDNRAKALRAYGKPGRFRHDFKSPAKVSHVSAGRIVIASSSRIWRSAL